ncbi:LysR substrate-binding domain-containing protein [Bordetella sp. 02P26C-1]|uniref:LysR substrate-binding domain-containing protein n=1 Tax=Bordetella sp. 02P26C-1 TaxID=2683195 RepID=UPI001352F2C7|nr:LysR substrate-binding domain-containing protein [Bordetella sp. 02P26C-1]MVW77625.1 LysR family transcriptional regulator [Bordetella sp. 02P26C-1]
MDSLPPLNALRAFEVVGRLCSVSAAAQELCVTPAAVSRQIHLLEDYLRTALFYRRHRRITLTAAGRDYHQEITRHLAGIRRVTRTLRHAAASRVFNLRAPHTIAMRWLLPQLASLHAAHPELEVRLHTSAFPPDFDSEDLDAAVVLNEGRAPGLVHYQILENEISPVCTPTVAARLERIEQLLDETLLHTHARPDDWTMWFEHVGLPLAGASRDMRFESSALAYEAAVSGYGIAMGQKSLIQQELADGRLVAPFDRWMNLGAFTYYIVMPRRNYESQAPEAIAMRKWIESISIGEAIPC